MRRRGPALLAVLALAAGAAEAQQRTRSPQRAPVEATLPATLERRVSLDEIGREGGLDAGADGAEAAFPLPQGLPGLGGRLVLNLGVLAPAPGRHAAEIRVNGRLLAVRRIEAGARETVEIAVPAEEMSGQALRLGLRLQEAGAARAVLEPDSALALLVPRDAPLTPAALLRLLPREVEVVLPRGTVQPAYADAALQAALAVAETGREPRITAGQPPDPAPPWRTGTVLVGGREAEAAQVVRVGPFPALALGRDARLPGVAPLPAAGLSDLPFPAAAPQDGDRPVWTFGFAARNLPPRTAPQSVDIEVAAPPGRGTLLVLMNGTLLGSVAAGDRTRLSAAVPAGLLRLRNTVEVRLQRAPEAAVLPAQLLPESAIRLRPHTAPVEFPDLPAFYAEGVEVLVEGLGIESLNQALWVLRAVLPPGAPLRLTQVPPGEAPRPSGPFVALTSVAPPGRVPPLPDVAGPALALRLVRGDVPGLWLNAPNSAGVPPLPPGAAALDGGDRAILDAQGVLHRSLSAPRRGTPALAAEPAASASSLAWRQWAVGLAWIAGFGLVTFAFARPRR